jgi:signal transduction histidine kinase
VWLRVGRELQPAASWPDEPRALPSLALLDGDIPHIPGVTRAVAVRDHGELLGALDVVKRPGEHLSPSEDKLLTDLASQAGLVLRNVRLTAELEARLEELSRQATELRASRQRIAEAGYATRRRIERDLHDGAQQRFVAVAVKLGLARQLVDQDPAAAGDLLEELTGDLKEAVQELRDFAHGIYPPLLVDRGLGEALLSAAERCPLPTAVRVDGLRRYAPDVEAAVYFCCVEALQNAHKHAGAATRAGVGLREADGWLHFDVDDDGAGFDTELSPDGAGLLNMRDRLGALGGRLRVASSPGVGTSVTGAIPLSS